MHGSLYAQLLDLACGVFLLAAAVVLWRRDLAAIVRAFAVQGLALGAVALVLGLHDGRAELVAVACGITVLRAGLLPYLLRRTPAALVAAADQGAPRADPWPTAGTVPAYAPRETYDARAREEARARDIRARAEARAREARETRPVVNVSASLLAAALLTLLAYAVCRPLVELDPTPATRALPVGVAAALIGFFVLATRRRALAQVVGFLLLDNGITATAFLATSGVPLIVEAGVSFDVLLAVIVLRLLTARVRDAFGTTDLDDLRELHD